MAIPLGEAYRAATEGDITLFTKVLAEKRSRPSNLANSIALSALCRYNAASHIGLPFHGPSAGASPLNTERTQQKKEKLCKTLAGARQIEIQFTE